MVRVPLPTKWPLEVSWGFGVPLGEKEGARGLPETLQADAAQPFPAEQRRRSRTAVSCALNPSRVPQPGHYRHPRTLSLALRSQLAAFLPPAAWAHPGPGAKAPLSPTTYLAKGPKILEKIALSTCLSEWPTAARPRVSRARQREPRSQRRLRSCIRLRRPRGSSAKSGARKAPAKEENAFGGSSWSGGELNPRDTPLGGPARTEAATDPGRLAANSASTLECRRGQVVRAGAPCSGCSGGPSARAANAGSAIPPFRQLRVLRIRRELEFI